MQTNVVALWPLRTVYEQCLLHSCRGRVAGRR
jgi:hypothetical protein